MQEKRRQCNEYTIDTFSIYIYREALCNEYVIILHVYEYIHINIYIYIYIYIHIYIFY